jgi:hypothetical protein
MKARVPLILARVGLQRDHPCLGGPTTALGADNWFGPFQALPGQLSHELEQKTWDRWTAGHIVVNPDEIIHLV